MHLILIDGKAFIPKYKIITSIDELNDELLKEIAPFYRVEYGFITYSNEEKNEIESILISFQLEYSIELFTYDAETIEKINTKTYSSRSEALEDLDYSNLTLDEYKQKKIKRLNELRKRELEAGFFTAAIDGTPIEFSYDELAQQRFDRQATLLSINPNIETIEWKTKYHGFVIVSREVFLEILNSAAEHEKEVEYKFLYAEANIYNASTREEIDAIIESY